MADILSVIASIEALVQISAKIIGNTTQLYYSGKDVPASICRIKNEMGQLNLILRQMQSLIQGYERKSLNQHRLPMFPLQDLMILLTACVSAYSALDKTLSKAVGLVDKADAGRSTPQTHVHAPSHAGSSLMGIQWNHWKESEAIEIIANIERHKSSLHIMLTIIQRYVVDLDNMIYLYLDRS